MRKYYTSERNILMLLSLLKAHNIRKIVASPGTKNIPFVYSASIDDFFEIYSSVDERSACYIACGLAEESGEPVVITCTGATASRNYMSGLTEAYYRKLPVLAVTFLQNNAFIGHLVPQVIDRRQQLNDIVMLSEQIDVIKDSVSEWDANIKINKALLELNHNPSGPVHLNVETTNGRNFSIEKLPLFRVIKRYDVYDELPSLPNGRIAIYVGSHMLMTENLENKIDEFCKIHNAVVFCDHTSGYHGKFRIQFSLVLSQLQYKSSLANMNLLIHIGETSGDYPLFNLKPEKVWRVSEDGQLRDRYKCLENVFEMREDYFFCKYLNGKEQPTTYYRDCIEEISSIKSNLPEIPFSNIWVASCASKLIPQNSVLHMAILNSLRSWNLFELPSSVKCYANTGGFGIDGGMSSTVEGSLVYKKQIHSLIIGDLSFFYDMNVLGNRHVNSNLRILLVNNGTGCEFKIFKNLGSMFGEEADDYLAAGGHFGNKSRDLVKNYVQSLGFEYLFADTKESFNSVIVQFMTKELTDKPLLLEVFTNSEDENDALFAISNIKKSTLGMVKNVVKSLLGEKGRTVVQKIVSR